MIRGNLNVEVVSGTVEGRTFRGGVHRRATVLLRFGRHSISLQAFKLGLILVICQILDGLLTYVGLYLHGVQMEGNAFLKSLIEAYGLFTGLFVVKVTALILAVGLMIYAHKQRWIRPVLFLICAVYILLAVVPWVYIISHTTALRSRTQEKAEVQVESPFLNKTTVNFLGP